MIKMEEKKLEIKFNENGFWQVFNQNFEIENLSDKEKETLKECIASFCEDLEMEEEDFYFL